MTLFDKLKAMFTCTDPLEDLEERFAARLQDIQDHPEKYKHITDIPEGQNSFRIPPLSLF